jgi:hypothetical protein
MSSLFSQVYAPVHRLVQRFPGLTLSLLALAFYLYTMAPSVNWADGARMQLDVMLGGSSYTYLEEVAAAPTDGLPFDRLGVAAWDHPLYVMLGQVFLLLPGAEPSFRINLMSGVIAALVVGLTYRIAFLLVDEPWAAAIGALSLMVSHTFWFHAVTSEVYALGLLFMAILVRLALAWAEKQRWRTVYLLALVAGLGVANHRLFVLTVLPTAIFFLATAHDRAGLAGEALRWRGIKVVALFLVGLAPWWVQFIRMARIIGVPLTWEMAGTFAHLGRQLSIGSWEKLAANSAGYLAWLLYQFTPLGLGLGCIGFRWMWQTRRRAAQFLLAVLAAHVVFSANFSVTDQFTFHLPSYWVFSIGIAGGAAWLHIRLERTRPRVAGRIRTGVMLGTVLIPIGLYSLAPAAAGWIGLTEADFGIYPIGTGVRDAARYFLNPNKRGDDSAARFGRTTLRELAPQALVLAPVTSEQEAYIILRYFQLVEGMRPDVRLDMMMFTPVHTMPKAVLAQVNTQVWCRPIYITSLNPASFPVSELETSFDLVPEANLLRLIPLTPSPEPMPCPDVDAEWGAASLQELIRRAYSWP